MTDTIDTKGLLAGALGGIAGMVAMRLYWSSVTAITGSDPRMATNESAPHALDQVGVAGQQHRPGEPSTAAAGRHAYEAATDDEPGDDAQEQLSYSVHYGFGLSMAALYGAVRGRADAPDTKGGLAFGAAVWALGDELLVPLMGLADGPTAFPVRQHVHRLGSHLAYGVATASTAQLIRGLIDEPPTLRGTAWSALKSYAKWRLGKKAVKKGLRAFR